MTDRVVYFNGEYVPEREARVSIFDSALMFGDMVFEMTRTFGGRPFRLRDHLERLYLSLRLLEIDCGLSIDDMERISLETLERNRPTEADDVDWFIMHDVSRGPLSYETTSPRTRCGPSGVNRSTSIAPSLRRSRNRWPQVSTKAQRSRVSTTSRESMIVPEPQEWPEGSSMGSAR